MCKSKKIRPLGDKILVERNEAQEMTEGGIIIPDASQEKPLEATVVAVGNGRVDKSGNVTPLVVKEGDRVLFSKYGGAELSVDGKDLLILEETDILAVLN